MDPKFTAALSQVQVDPMKAMAMLSSNPEMQKALQEFSGILGEHFSALGTSTAGLVRGLISLKKRENGGVGMRAKIRGQDKRGLKIQVKGWVRK